MRKQALEELLWPMMSGPRPQEMVGEHFLERLTHQAQSLNDYVPDVDNPIIDEIILDNFFYLDSRAIQNTDQHLDRFERGLITRRSQANQVNVQLRINGEVEPLSPKGEESNFLQDQKISSEMKRPNGSTEAVVVHTQNDGEVTPLAQALKVIVRYLKSSNGEEDCAFAVSLYGAWGACDGCKKRIERFAELWVSEARRRMQSTKTAILTITYQYLNVPATIVQTYGDNFYGWEEDGKKAPLFHTLEATITGM